MGLLLSRFGMPAGASNDGDALYGLEVVCDLTDVVSVSGSVVNVSPSCGTDGVDGVCIFSIKTEGWRATGESTLGGVVFSSISTLPVRRGIFLRP